MATLGGQYLTYGDMIKRFGADDKYAKICEYLMQENEMLEDMVMKESNQPTTEKVVIRTGLPTAYYKLANQPVPISKSTTAQIVEGTACLESWSEIDETVANYGGNPGQARLSEAKAFMQAMNQKQQFTMIYGSAANPEEYVGFANRYGDLSATNAQNILDCGGTGSDNTSVYLIGWGENACYGIYPQGSKGGLGHNDHGKQVLNKTEGGVEKRQVVFQDQWYWDHGLVVKDWRYIVRMANINVSDLKAITGTQALTAYATNILDQMSRAYDLLPRKQGGIKPAYYMNRGTASAIRILAKEKGLNTLETVPGLNQLGESIFTMRFLGIPIRIVDQLLNTEAQVV